MQIFTSLVHNTSLDPDLRDPLQQILGTAQTTLSISKVKACSEGLEYNAESEVSLIRNVIIIARFQVEPMNNISHRKYTHHVGLVLKLTYRLTSMALVVRTDFSSVCNHIQWNSCYQSGH